MIAFGFVLIYKATEAITDYQDIFGYQIQFGPEDQKGVSESLLSLIGGMPPGIGGIGGIPGITGKGG